MANSTKPIAVKKPYLDFPLFPHATGRWAKKVRGKFSYFGKTAEDPTGQAALSLWLEQKDELLAGRKPRKKIDELTVAELCNRFLSAKQNQRDNGELSPRSWNNYKSACDRIVKQFGSNRLIIDLSSEDFELLRNEITKTYSITSLGVEITRVRVIFKYAYDAGLIPLPIRYGSQFKAPSAKARRIERGKQPLKLFSADEIQAMLKQSRPQLRCMILLAINCGFGNHDCATLPIRVVDLKAGWIDYPRPKTGVHRRCPLWPETIKALRDVLATRKKPKNKEHNESLFITAKCMSFAKETTGNPLNQSFDTLLKKLSLKQRGRSFYALRHTFRTIADESRDQPACDHVMGHSSGHISAHYRERIDDSRLQAVADYVHAWLLGKEGSSNG